MAIAMAHFTAMSTDSAGMTDPWDVTTLAALGQERREQLPSEGLAKRQAWRDRRLMALMAHQRHIETQ